MVKYIMNYLKKMKYKRHARRVEARIAELYKQISEQAVKFGFIDQKARARFLKYNGYLVKLQSKIK